MTRDELLRMAREADLWMTSEERIAAAERFAGLVDQKACQREHQWMSDMLGAVSLPAETLDLLLDAIKARGNQ